MCQMETPAGKQMGMGKMGEVAEWDIWDIWDTWA